MLVCFIVLNRAEARLPVSGAGSSILSALGLQRGLEYSCGLLSRKPHVLPAGGLALRRLGCHCGKDGFWKLVGALASTSVPHGGRRPAGPAGHSDVQSGVEGPRGDEGGASPSPRSRSEMQGVLCVPRSRFGPCVESLKVAAG